MSTSSTRTNEVALLAKEFLALARESVQKARHPEEAETSDGAYAGATAKSYAGAALSAIQGYATVVKLAAEQNRRRP